MILVFFSKPITPILFASPSPTIHYRFYPSPFTSADYQCDTVKECFCRIKWKFLNLLFVRKILWKKLHYMAKHTLQTNSDFSKRLRVFLLHLHAPNVDFHNPYADFHTPYVTLPYYTAFGSVLYSLRPYSVQLNRINSVRESCLFGSRTELTI